MKYNENFLKEFDNQRNKTIYARIISLDFQERPQEIIEGRVTGGSINLDGNSAVRRTCQLNMVAPEVNITDYFWSLHTKFKLSIGVENLVDKNYPDIIWFEQGIYLITSFSSVYSTNSYSINISGKDKMCLLNGEIGGSINSSVDFGTIEELNTETQVVKKAKLPVKNIIREMIHQYAGESFHNIIINDLDEMGLELQEYRYNTPMYIWRKTNEDVYINGTLNEEQSMYWETIDDNGDSIIYTTLKDLKEHGFKFEKLTDNFQSVSKDTAYYYDKEDKKEFVYIAEITYGQTAGYKEIDLIYPNDLIANIGETITSILDKIKNFLGDFEYFYNIDGQFVFQKKKTYINTAWSPIQQNEDNSSYVQEYMAASPYSYIFTGSKFFTALNNTPNLPNLRNDFSVWGSRHSSSGNDLLVHMRYAIDKKPTSYTSITVSGAELEDYNKKYGFNVQPQESKTYIADNIYEADDEEVHCDWRELIYQMAKDYRKYNHLDNFELKIIEANKVNGLYQNGRTGYEQYYIDMEGFWRQLYNPFGEEIKGNEYDDAGWNVNIQKAPELLNFWFDFLDSEGELDQFTTSTVGDRPKVVNDKDVKAIYYRETPLIVFYSGGLNNTKSGYRYFNIGPYDSMFAKSSQGKSAKDAIDTLLYNHSYCVESISITSIPIYYLEPNTIIYVSDPEAKIEGEYLVSKMTIPLSYNGTMNITATKAPRRLF